MGRKRLSEGPVLNNGHSLSETLFGNISHRFGQGDEGTVHAGSKPGIDNGSEYCNTDCAADLSGGVVHRRADPGFVEREGHHDA